FATSTLTTAQCRRDVLLPALPAAYNPRMKKLARALAALVTLALAVVLVPASPARGGDCEDKCDSKRSSCDSSCGSKKNECILKCGIPFTPGYDKCTQKCTDDHSNCTLQCRGEQEVCKLQCKGGK